MSFIIMEFTYVMKLKGYSLLQRRRNLRVGSHEIEGLTEHFSTVEYFCRYCVTSTEFHNDPLCISTKRNHENYNEALRILYQKR